MSSGRFGVFAGSTPLALGLPKSAALERAADEARGHRVVYVVRGAGERPCEARSHLECRFSHEVARRLAARPHFPRGRAASLRDPLDRNPPTGGIVPLMSTTAVPTVRIFRALGMTDEVTTCDHCGRAELKGTMKLAFLDAEGNVTGDLAYYGTGCAATAGKRTVKDIRDEGKANQEAAREALRAERDRLSAEWTARRNAWISTNVAPDALDRPRAYGYNSTVKLVQAFIDATGDRP